MTAFPRTPDTAEAVPIVAGMAALAERYEGFILDLWGTIHDGLRPWAGAGECLAELKRRGKRILLLSNAPRRSHLAIERLGEMGIARALYDDVLTSGEAANRALLHRNDDWHRRLGRRCYLLGPPKDDSVLEQVPHARAAHLADAEFIVNVGTFRRLDGLDAYEDLMQEAAARKLPMVCCNPDYEVLRGDDRELCAGAIARRYEELGGDVYYHGKPHAPIYDESLKRLGIADPRSVVAVGDALRTDVAGAAAYGMDSVLVVSTGILAKELAIAPFEDPAPAALTRLFQREGQRPTAATAAFRW
ncbi:MAG: TIGR01459 family HAD-type hydrolase [Alphaproteobacteria bacterium]